METPGDLQRYAVDYPVFFVLWLINVLKMPLLSKMMHKNGLSMS